MLSEVYLCVYDTGVYIVSIHLLVFFFIVFKTIRVNFVKFYVRDVSCQCGDAVQRWRRTITAISTVFIGISVYYLIRYLFVYAGTRFVLVCTKNCEII